MAEEILALKAALKQRLDEALQAGAFTETLRTRTIIGLHLKALDCFDRLIIDARDRRGEASHHLKTMVECFIYSHWVSCDKGETRARLLSAEGYRSRAAYHESIEEKEYAATWREMQRQETQGLETEWEAFKPKLQQLAPPETKEHYDRIYRFACEAAHIGDLRAYTPPFPQEPGLRLSHLSMLRAYISINFGIILACDLLQDASIALKLGAAKQIDGFRERWRAIIALGPATSGGSN
ncbi:MAG: DUF5677 domain-containing protein [Nitrospirota bacterium]